MGLKDTFESISKAVTDTTTDTVQSIKNDVKEAASEARHHAAAQAESAKRADDSLSPLEKTQSIITEVREESLAKVDSLRQAIRKNV